MNKIYYNDLHIIDFPFIGNAPEEPDVGWSCQLGSDVPCQNEVLKCVPQNEVLKCVPKVPSTVVGILFIIFNPKVNNATIRPQFTFFLILFSNFMLHVP